MDHPLAGSAHSSRGEEGGGSPKTSEGHREGGASPREEGGSGEEGAKKAGRKSFETDQFLNKMMTDNPELFITKEKGVSFGNVSNKDYRVVVLDGPDRESKFICNVCDKECPTVTAVKTHITKTHVKVKQVDKDKSEKKNDANKGKGGKRKLSSPEVQDKEDKRRRATKEFNLANLEYWSNAETAKDDDNQSKDGEKKT